MQFLNPMIACAFLLALTATVSHGQPAGENMSLTESDIVRYLDKKIPEGDIINLVHRQRVDFALTPTITAGLVRKGAGDNLLKAIENGKATQELEIISPFANQEVRHSAPVRGRSRDFSAEGKYLWLFAHREDLVDMWWPQHTHVNLGKSGEWSRGVTFGTDDDIGFDFEVVAMWVDSTINRNLKNYMLAANRQGHYPPMPLPTGSPVTTVRVRRVH